MIKHVLALILKSFRKGFDCANTSIVGIDFLLGVCHGNWYYPSKTEDMVARWHMQECISKSTVTEILQEELGRAGGGKRKRERKLEDSMFCFYVINSVLDWVFA